MMVAEAVQATQSLAPIIAYIGIGSNLGQSATLVQQAIDDMAGLPQTQLRAQSGFYRSAPLDADGDDYINAVVQLHTSLSASALLTALQAIELRHGRARSYLNAPRTLDLDLLLYAQQNISLPDLQVPHPRLQLRAFVLQPLLAIAPNIHIPGLGAAVDFLAATADQKIELASPAIFY